MNKIDLTERHLIGTKGETRVSVEQALIQVAKTVSRETQGDRTDNEQRARSNYVRTVLQNSREEARRASVILAGELTSTDQAALKGGIVALVAANWSLLAGYVPSHPDNRPPEPEAEVKA